MNTKIIKLDINKELYTIVNAKQGDTKSRFLLFNLYDNSIPFSLVNKSVRAYARKPDGLELFNDLKIINTASGSCELELTNQLLSTPGIVRVELMILEGEKKLTSIPFQLKVIESINSEKAVISTNEFSALVNALNKADEYNKELQAASEGLEFKYTEKLNGLDSQLADIKHLNYVYVETWGDDITAQLGKINKPFKTIDGALSAISVFGGYNIMLGIGNFTAPPKSKWKSNVNLIGAKKPSINSSKSALENGTIVQGYLAINDYNNIKIENIGVDFGVDVSNNLFGGISSNALAIASTNVNTPLNGIIVRNVITLIRDSHTSYHSTIIEGVDNSLIENLETWHGVHGLAFKGTNTIIKNVIANDSDADGVIIKDSLYARCKNVIVENILIRSSNGTHGGLALDNQEGTGNNLRDINISNLTIVNTKFGIKFNSKNGNPLQVINLNNVILESITGNAIETIGSCSLINVDNVQIPGVTESAIVLSDYTSKFNFSNGVTVGAGSGKTAIKLNGDNNTINNLTISGFSTNWDFKGYMNKVNNSTIGTYTGTPATVRVNNADIFPIEATLVNGYTNQYPTGVATAGYYIDKNTVFLKGGIKPGTLSSAMFTLPFGYRPALEMDYLVNAQNSYAKISILNNGQVICTACDGTYFSLNGISFPIE